MEGLPPCLIYPRVLSGNNNRVDTQPKGDGKRWISTDEASKSDSGVIKPKILEDSLHLLKGWSVFLVSDFNGD
jgi:hypothetical protein